jgi:Na+(H+)/acetate symporter ActP
LDALDHNLSALVIVPPIGLEENFQALALALCFACLVGVVILGLGSLRTGRRGAFAPAMFSLLALTLILGALGLWDLVG